VGHLFMFLVGGKTPDQSVHLNLTTTKYIQAMPECIESDKVTGEDCFVMRLVVRDIAQLDTLLDGLAEYAQCNTSVVKSSPVKRRLPPL
ncbi:Lrp/AsnC ligand binding domain-containing protein, partial [Klebsiella pneumoniae]|uniref:Lrp/AsnC ligand binding domain-containing protein n=3 Tax=Klebsiella pneumoniae TaxID=573 RepID=UPI001E2D8FF0